jgi:hypothetical protein
MASDLTDGSTSVKIGGDAVCLKDKSSFKKTSGDEAGNAGTKGVVSMSNTGAVFFAAWSMDVKIEGENAVRNLDVGTHNHASQPGNGPPWPFIATMNPGMQKITECKDDVEAVERDCRTSKPPDKCTQKCAKAQKCVLAPKSKDKQACCGPDTTGHHLVEVHCFSKTGARGSSLEGFEDYSQNKAPCVCASQSRHEGCHQTMHAVQGKLEGAYDSARSSPLASWAGAGAKLPGGGRAPATSKWTYGEARDAGVKAHQVAFPHCDAACVKKQLDAYHNDCGVSDDTPVRTDPMAGTRTSDECLQPADRDALNAQVDSIQGTVALPPP